MSSHLNPPSSLPADSASSDIPEEHCLAQVFSFGWGERGRLGIGLTAPKTHTSPHPIFALHWRGREDRQVKQVACGGKHTLFLLNDLEGSVYSCGCGAQGQLGQEQGDATTVAGPNELWTPRLIQGGENQEGFIHVAAGHMTSFAINHLGDIYGWGSNRYAALGLEEAGEGQYDEEGRMQGQHAPTYPVPTLVTALSGINITHLSTMGWHVLALAQDKRLFSWGRNHMGQCGIGNICAYVARPTQVEFLHSERPINISAGFEHSVAIVEVERTREKKDRVVYTWGNPANHRLGGVDPKRHFSPQENRSLSTLQAKKTIEIKQVAAGGMHNLCITGLGVVWSWGGGIYGQLGNGHLWDKMMPVPVPEITAVKTVVAGLRHSLAVRDNGEVWGWGWNGFGEVGMGDEQIKLQPHCLFAFKRSKVLQAYAGERHSVVITRGIATKASEEEEYQSYFSLLDEAEGSPRVKEELKRVMKTEGLDDDILNSKDGLVPGQPGMKDEDIKIEEEKYDLPWCLDTWSKSQFLAKCSWPTRYECKACKKTQICMACARKCHRGHGLIVHMTSRKKGDRCDCSVSKTCVCRWSELRHEFRNHMQADGEYILGKQLRGLLEVLRTGQPFNVEDLEAAYTELCLSGGDGSGEAGRDMTKTIDEAQITWSAFEIFYEEWFGEKDAANAPLPGGELEEEDEEEGQQEVGRGVAAK